MIGPLNRNDVLVSTDWLENNLDNPNLRILDCRFYFDRDAREEYDAGHIPGALHFDWTKELNDPDSPVESMLASAEHIAESLRSFGISNDTQIIGYDDEGGHFASRLWLALARYGKSDQMRILHGGWTRWTQEDRLVTTDIPAVDPGTFRFDADSGGPDLIADLDTVRDASENGTALLFDVRRLSEFTGEEVRAKHGGRIPGARRVFWHDNMHWDGDRTFRSNEEIADRPEISDVDRDTPIITYCQGGVRAAHAAMALRFAGFNNVRVYDGSWAEWGNRDDVPIEAGDADNN